MTSTDNLVGTATGLLGLAIVAGVANKVLKEPARRRKRAPLFRIRK